MATPKPGEIRCPTCHRSTPPATFCTQCGSAIPSDARIRPRGMDRDELQERIRARRSGGEPYRRGAPADDELAYQRFEPEPEDEGARRARGVEPRRTDAFDDRPASVFPTAPDREPVEARPADVTRDADHWEPRSVPPPPAPEPAYAPPEEPEYVDNFDDEAYEDAGYGYDHDEWTRDRERRSGAGAFAILGFLALGVLALLGGALLAGLFSDQPGVGQGDPTPTAAAIESASAAPVVSASAAPSGAVSPPASQAAQPSGEPVVFPDGFTAEAQACLPGSADLDGCESNGAVNSGATDIWIGFSGGNADDVVGATLLASDGQQLAEGSIELSQIQCVESCQGYTRFNFSNLDPGNYTVEVTRNGQLADRITFEVQ